jgi:hypothetical protein
LPGLACRSFNRQFGQISSGPHKRRIASDKGAQSAQHDQDFLGVYLNQVDHPIHAQISPVSGFNSGGIGEHDRKHLAVDCELISDGLACFLAVTAAI